MTYYVESSRYGNPWETYDVATTWEDVQEIMKEAECHAGRYIYRVVLRTIDESGNDIEQVLKEKRPAFENVNIDTVANKMWLKDIQRDYSLDDEQMLRGIAAWLFEKR